MPTSFTYPSTAELMEIEQEKLPVLINNDPVFQLFPIQTKDTPVVMWEQKDSYTGLQQVRGLNGDPPRVKRLGGTRFTMEPGYYGEFTTIDEAELTVRRQYGTFNRPIGIEDLVMECQDHLLNRRIDRMRLIMWNLLTTGTFSVAGPNGSVLHTDSYAFQTHNASTWGTVTTATPLLDLRAAQLLARGRSVSFGRDSRAMMNLKTKNNLVGNTNPSDLGAPTRQSNGSTMNSLEDMNKILIANDLPPAEVYDEGYLQEGTGTFIPFIPDGVVVLVGKRISGQPIGHYQMTRNANNPQLAPGAYTRVIDHGDERIPRLIEVHDGHNGGPTMEFPSAVVIIDVS